MPRLPSHKPLMVLFTVDDWRRPQGGALARSQPRMMAGSATEEEPDRRSFFQRSATGAAAITGSSWLGGVPSSHAAKSTAWTQVRRHENSPPTKIRAWLSPFNPCGIFLLRLTLGERGR
jgi:hypothetical protein